MNIHDRLKKVIDDENISISKFERIIGVGQNSVSTCLRRESSIGHKMCCKEFVSIFQTTVSNGYLREKNLTTK